MTPGARSGLVASLLLLAGCAAEPAPAATEPAPPASVSQPYRAPVPFEGGGIGAELPRDLAWSDVRTGRSGTLGGLLEGAPAVVVVSTALGCPLTRLYAPLLRERLEPWAARGVRVLVLASWPEDGEDALRAKAELEGWTWPLTRDAERRWTAALQAERTTDAFLIDGAGRLRYRGALDDQFGNGYHLAAPRHRYLDDALEAVLAGREPPVAATRAPGCLLPRY